MKTDNDRQRARTGRWTFGLRPMLAIFVVIAALLSFVYPKVYCSTIIHCPSLQQGEAFTYHAIATSESCLKNAIASSPEFAKLMKSKSRNWLMGKVKIRQSAANEIEVRVNGMAIERSRLQTIADCIAQQVVEVQSSKITELQSEVRGLVETAKRELAADLEEQTNPVVRRRQERLRSVIDERLEDMKATFIKEQAQLPKIDRRSHGLEFKLSR